MSSHQQTIISFVPSNSNPIGKKVNPHVYVCILPCNRRYYDVDSFTVFRGIPLVYKQVLFPILQLFLGIVNFRSGLQAYCTQLLGQFFMIGLRQSTMSNARMVLFQPHTTRHSSLHCSTIHHYVAHQAMKTQIHGGDVRCNAKSVEESF